MAWEVSSIKLNPFNKRALITISYIQANKFDVFKFIKHFFGFMVVPITYTCCHSNIVKSLGTYSLAPFYDFMGLKMFVQTCNHMIFCKDFCDFESSNSVHISCHNRNSLPGCLTMSKIKFSLKIDFSPRWQRCQLRSY